MKKKVFLDTNILLGVYRGEINLSDLNKLEKTHSFITTRQVIDEFHRNKNPKGSKIYDGIQKLNEFQKYDISTFNNICIEDKTVEISNLKESINNNIEEIKKHIYTADMIEECVDKLLNSKNTMIIEDCDNCFNKAIMRNKLGRIPRSDNKSTICDEYIWESILKEGIKELVFVSKDNTYTNENNIKILKQEYENIVKGKIYFVADLKSALKMLEEDNELELTHIENHSIKDFQDYQLNSLNNIIQIYLKNDCVNDIRNYIVHNMNSFANEFLLALINNSMNLKNEIEKKESFEKETPKE